MLYKFTFIFILSGLCVFGTLPVLSQNSAPLPCFQFLSVVVDTNNWIFTEEMLFDEEGNPRHSGIQQLLESLNQTSGTGMPLSADEFKMIIARHPLPRAYAKQLIKYATPQSKKIQDDAHSNYLNKLLRTERQEAGVKFVLEHSVILNQVQMAYNIHPKDIVSILMWESGLGQYTGKYRIFDIFMGQLLYLEEAEKYAIVQLCINGDTTLNNLPDQTRRFKRIQANAIKNLTALLRITKQLGSDPLEHYGSWGGAIGYVQFMPASLKFAVDGDQDGIIDLYNWSDAIYSVANYLNAAGYNHKPNSRRRAIFAYNHLDSYVNGVIEYADAVWNRFNENVTYK
ncbi:lytic murein transglycosylase [candidate division KSB1 bacterium]|nr:lytic murein transglycosylase [candidate division KSB1 bacterium]